MQNWLIKIGVARIKPVLRINLNTNFINIGCELADKLSRNNDDNSLIQYIKRSFWDSLRGILVLEVYDLLMGKNKSTIGVPRKFINLSSSY